MGYLLSVVLVVLVHIVTSLLFVGLTSLVTDNQVVSTVVGVITANKLIDYFYAMLYSNYAEEEDACDGDCINCICGKKK
jgi:hypothetical protein